MDVEALVRNGEDLDMAIRDAPLRDSGFSPLTLAWVLRELDVTAGNSAADAARLDAFRERLIERLVTP